MYGFPMLEQLTFTGRELLIAVILATAVYLLEVLIFSARRRRDAAAARQPSDASVARVEALERRLDVLEARVALLAELATEPAPVPSGRTGDAADYGEAMRRAGAGATPEQLADELGLSRGEAELIIALRRAEPAPDVNRPQSEP